MIHPYDWPGSIDFTLEDTGVARPDGPVGLRIDGRALMSAAGLDGAMDFRSLRVEDLNDFAGFWAYQSPRACPAQFVPDADFHPADHPKGTLWFRLHKPAWEDKAFPRHFRLRLAPVVAGGRSGTEARPANIPSPLLLPDMTVDPRGGAIWSRQGHTCLRYEAPGDEPTGKPRIPEATTPAGHALLADQPRDHPWHRGLAIGWTAVECEQAGLRPYCYWVEPGGGHWWPHPLQHVQHGPVISRLTSRIAYGTQEGEHVFDLAVDLGYAAGDTGWDYLDIAMTLTAGDAPASFQSHYGHLKARMALDLQHAALVAADGERTTEHDGKEMRDPTTVPWVGITGWTPTTASPVSLLMLDHPTNPHAPACADGEVSRREGFADQGILFAWCGLNPVRVETLRLEPRETTTFRYRLVLSDRELSPGYGEYHHAAWARPWRVTTLEKAALTPVTAMV